MKNTDKQDFLTRVHNSKAPHYSTDQFNTLLEMKEYDENHIPEGVRTLCLENNKHYSFSSKNPLSETTGHWKLDENEYVDPDDLRNRAMELLETKEIHFYDMRSGSATDYCVGYTDASGNPVTFPVNKRIRDKNYYVSSDFGWTPIYKATLDETDIYAECPTGFTSLIVGLFDGCTSLTEVVIPSNITSIETDTFADCGNIETYMFWSSTPATLEQDALKINEHTKILVELENLATYKDAWVNYYRDIYGRHFVDFFAKKFIRVKTNDTTVTLDYDKVYEINNMEGISTLDISFVHPSEVEISEYYICFKTDAVADFGLTVHNVTGPIPYTVVGVPDEFEKDTKYEMSFLAVGTEIICRCQAVVEEE